jgi:hypothetical protein
MLDQFMKSHIDRRSFLGTTIARVVALSSAILGVTRIGNATGFYNKYGCTLCMAPVSIMLCDKYCASADFDWWAWTSGSGHDCYECMAVPEYAFGGYGECGSAGINKEDCAQYCVCSGV